MGKLRVLTAIVVMALLTGACSGGSDSGSDEAANASSLRGTVALYPNSEVSRVGGFYEEGGECDGVMHPSTNVPIYSKEFHVFEAGASIVVKDESGKIVGSGELSPGKVVAHPADGGLSDHVCEMPFDVDVSDAEFYTVSVGEFEGSPIPVDEISSPVILKFED